MASVDKKWIIVLLLMTVCIQIASALQASSPNYSIDAYIGFGATTENISAGNLSSGFGQIIIGRNNISYYDTYFGIFNMINTTVIVVPACAPANLPACLNSITCTNAGGYWYLGSCHATPYVPPNGGGGSGGSTFSEPKYLVYPKTFYETIEKGTILSTEFYIENQEYSYPLSITIDSNLSIFSKQFDISPGRIAMINFKVDCTNKTEGYYTDIIQLKIVKTATGIKYENITVSYYVKQTKVIDFTNTTVIVTPQNRTIIDIIPMIVGDKTTENIINTVNAIDKIITNPLFFIIIISILLIMTVVMQQTSEGFSGKDFIPSSITEYALYFVTILIPIGLCIWIALDKSVFSLIIKWYTNPLFLIIAFCILAILTIVILQIKKEHDSKFTISKSISILLLAVVIFAIVRNSRLITKFVMSDAFSNFFSSPLFIIISASIILIFTIVMIQMRVSQSSSSARRSSGSGLLYIIITLILAGAGYIIYMFSTHAMTINTIKSLYTQPAFFIIVLSLLILIAIILLQLGKDQGEGVKLGNLVVLGLILTLFLVIFKNSNMINWIFYNIPKLGSWFLLIIGAILAIFIIVFLQLRKR